MKQLPSPTSRELEILKVLWEHGPSSVRKVHELIECADGDILAYNTVQTLLRIMEGKELVSHSVEGRTFIYSPNFSQEETASRFLDHVFDGATSKLVLSLLRAEKIPVEELERLQKIVSQARESARDRRN